MVGRCGGLSLLGQGRRDRITGRRYRTCWCGHDNDQRWARAYWGGLSSRSERFRRLATETVTAKSNSRSHGNRIVTLFAPGASPGECGHAGRHESGAGASHCDISHADFVTIRCSELAEAALPQANAPTTTTVTVIKARNRIDITANLPRAGWSW